MSIRGWLALAAIVAATIPLWWPAVPPLTDFPGHLGSYRILAEAGRGPLAHHYAVHWQLIGNLGVEALVLALRPLLGLETAAKLVVMAIPALTVGAMLWLAREAHGRVPLTAPFAFPLAYALPFQFGFVNFSLSAALALGALALWLKLARTRPAWWRAALFAPIACLIWLCHSFGWAMTGLFVLGAELVLRRRAGERWPRAMALAGLVVLPMALPLTATATGLAQPAMGDTGDWFDWPLKLVWLLSVLRERWLPYDLACAAGLLTLVALALRSPRLRLDPLLGVPALFGAGVFLLLPRVFEGGAYVDMRILPDTLVLAVLAIRVDPEWRGARWLAVGAVGFFVMRLATTTIVLAQAATVQTRELAALEALPVGSAVLVLEAEPAKTDWPVPRDTHLAGIAIERRRVFTNEQWALAGQQLIVPLHPAAAPYDRDPSQIVYPAGAGYQITDFDRAIARFDRGTFDRVWTIGFPPGRAHAADLSLEWQNGRSAVYRVDQMR
ncbi:MAG: hypothetical protein ACTHM0_04075 [Sphingomonas sp.]